MIQTSSNSGEHDVVKLCPLCNSAIRFFFINLTEKILMCENENCLYPFGYEDVTLISSEGINAYMDAASLPGPNNESTTTPATSSTSWSIIDKLNKVSDYEDNKVLNLDDALKNLKLNKKSDEKIMNNKEIKKNVQDLKCLTMELQEIEQATDEGEVIKNEKWIKKLMNLQGMSGVKLVKREEMESLKPMKPAFGGGELKIDIDTNKDNMSSINIQIMKKCDLKLYPKM